MGNLTNPVSLRIKSNLYWNSIWVSYIHSNYSYLLSTDYLLYSYLNWFISRKIFSNFGWLYFYSHYKLVRVANNVYIIFFFKDYKFYRFIFEYLSLILKIVSKKRTRFFVGSRFNWYKLQKSVYKTYFSRKFLNHFKVKNNLKINFLYYTCWLYTFYLIQQKFVSTKITKKKYAEVRFSSNVTNSNIFFFNIFKLGNFLNLFYFFVLLYFKKIKHLDIITICYSYYLFFRQHKDFYFFWFFCRRCTYFFKSDNNTDIILFSEFNKRSIRNKIYVFKRVVAKIPETFRYISKKKISILFNTSKITQLFNNFCNLRKKSKFSSNNILNLRKPKNKIRYCFNYLKNPHSSNVQIRNTEYTNNLLLDLFKCFDFDLSSYAKYTAVKKKTFFTQTVLADHQYNTYWDFAKRFFRHWSITLVALKQNTCIKKLKQLNLIYLKKYKVVIRTWIQIVKQLANASQRRRLSRKKKKFLRSVLYKLRLNSVRLRRKFKVNNRTLVYAKQKAFAYYCSLFFIKLFDIIKIDTTAFDFFLQYSDVVKNLYNKKQSKNFTKFLLVKFLFKIIQKTKYFIYFYYFKLYYYFYYFKFYSQLNAYFSGNLILVRKLLYLYKKLALKKITKPKLKTYALLLNNNITEIRDKNAFKLKYYLTKNLASKDFGKLYSTIRFKLKNLLVSRKVLFTKYTLNYKKYALSWKYKKYFKYRFIYYLLYPTMTFKRILTKYKKLRQMRISTKSFKYLFKKNLKFFFKKYVSANKLNLVKPFIINTNIFLFYKNILRNLLIIVQLRQSKNYLFTLKHLYYRFFCKVFILKRRAKVLDLFTINPYRTFCLYYMRKFFISLNNIYAINSNIFLTNYLKKIKNLFTFFGHKTFNVKLILPCLRDIHIYFFNFCNFFIVNLLEISKYRLYFSKYIYLFINTVTKRKQFNNCTIVKHFNRNFIKKKFIIASFFALPKKSKILKKFYYISKIRYISNLLIKRKNLFLFKINTNILHNLQLRLPLKSSKNFFFKQYGFSYKRNLIVNTLSHKCSKRVLNVFLYLNKYFVKLHFIVYYKNFRQYYKNLLNIKTKFCISDLKLLLYFCYWKKKKKNEQDILWLRQQRLYPLILSVKCSFTFVVRKISFLCNLGYILLKKSFNNVYTVRPVRTPQIFAGSHNLVTLGNTELLFHQIICSALYYKWCIHQVQLQKFHFFVNIFRLIFKKQLNNIFSVFVSFVGSIHLKKNYYEILYCFNMLSFLFKRIFYLFTYTTVICNAFFMSECSVFFKQRLKKEYSLTYSLYYKNIYLKNQKNLKKKILSRHLHFSNFQLCFFNYKTRGGLYKKNNFFFPKNIKIKKKRKTNRTSLKKKHTMQTSRCKVKKVSILNCFLKWKNLNFQKKRSYIYLKTLHKCFAVKSQYLKNLIVKKKKKIRLKKQTNKKKSVHLKKHISKKKIIKKKKK